MPYYKCEVINSEGKKKNLIKEANDQLSLKAYLKRDGYTLLRAQMIKEKKPNTFFSVSSKVKITEVCVFLRQFSVMINASISISDSLNTLKMQSFTKTFQKVLMEIHEDILSGKLLSDAFAKHPKVFPPFFCEMVAIGEVSGSLDKVLSSMADYYENDQKIRKKAKSAMVYPIILLVLVVVVIFFLSLVILPQFKDMFEQYGGEIPKFTQIVLAFSTFLKENLWFILFAIISLVLILFLFFAKTKMGKKALDWLKLNLPIIRNVTIATMSSRFVKAFIILLESGMNITDAMENLTPILNNGVFEEKFKFAIEEVKRGKRIAKSIEDTNIFPKLLTEMIKVGEKSGNLEEVLKSTSMFFDAQVESSISKATAALEPVMILLLGGMVAGVLLAVYLPMIDLMNQI